MMHDLYRVNRGILTGDSQFLNIDISFHMLKTMLQGSIDRLSPKNIFIYLLRNQHIQTWLQRIIRMHRFVRFRC